MFETIQAWKKCSKRNLWFCGLFMTRDSYQKFFAPNLIFRYTLQRNSALMPRRPFNITNRETWPPSEEITQNEDAINRGDFWVRPCFEKGMRCMKRWCWWIGMPVCSIILQAGWKYLPWQVEKTPFLNMHLVGWFWSVVSNTLNRSCLSPWLRTFGVNEWPWAWGQYKISEVK